MIYFRQAVRWIIILLVIWFFIHLSKSWLRPFIIEKLGGYTEKVIESRVDTISVVVTKRIPLVVNREVKVKDIPDPILGNTTSSTTKGGSFELTAKADNIYKYKTAISDSLIDGNITTLISLKDCKLISQSLNYTPKFPILVEKTITVEKTNTEILSNKNRIRIGIGATVNSNISAGGMLIYQTPKGLQYQAGYIFTKENLDNQFKDKQGYISVSVIKLF